MALTQLTTDLSNHQNLADKPNQNEGYTSTQLKVLYDKAPNDIKEYINTVLLPALESTTDGSSGAFQIGYPDATYTNVESIIKYILSLGTGTLPPDNSITDAKLSDTEGQIKDTVNSHLAEKANETDLGHVKVDGTTIVANDGTISVNVGVTYYQNTEPTDKTQGKIWFNPDTGQLLIADGTKYQSIPPVQVLEEVIDFDEDGITLTHNGTRVNAGDIELINDLYSTSAVSSQSRDLHSLYTNVDSFIIVPDGTGVIVANFDTDTIYYHPLSTPFDLTTFQASTASYYYGGTTGNADYMTWGDNGNKLYLLNRNVSPFNVYQFELSTPYDISTISYSNKYKTLSTNTYTSMTFNNDGSKMYATQYGSTDHVEQFDLTTPFDITTLVYVTKTEVTSQVGTDVMYGIMWSNDGTKLFISTNIKLYMYEAISPYDVTSLTYESSQNITSIARSIYWLNGGEYLYVLRQDSGNNYWYIDRYDCSYYNDGNTFIGFDNQQQLIKAWDLVTYQNTLDGETVTIDIEEGTVGTTLSRNNDTTSDSLSNKGIQITTHKNIDAFAITFSDMVVDANAIRVYDDIGEQVYYKYFYDRFRQAGEQYILYYPFEANRDYYITVVYSGSGGKVIASLIIGTDFDMTSGASSSSTYGYFCNIASITAITFSNAFTNIDQNFDISTIDPSYHVRLKVNLSRTDINNNPTCDYVARRFVR